MAVLSAHVEPNSRKARAGESRRRLLAAATQHFAARPFDAVTIQEIAGSAGLAFGLVAHHFGSKRGIYLAVLTEAMHQLDLTYRPDDRDPPGVQVREALAAHLAFMAENRELALRVILHHDGPDSEVSEIFERARWVRLEWACRALGVDHRHPILRPMLRAFGGAVDAATTHWLTHDDPLTADELSRALIGMFTAAIAGAHRLDGNLDVANALVALESAG